ncbi:hypothetical protein ZWY2020_013271 [Hordeum vulgare]|nr:hypothetical protein ZWY2020_013271 [Hordeum vulgare]
MAGSKERTICRSPWLKRKTMPLPGGRSRDLMAAGKHSEAMEYFMNQLNGDGMRNVPTQFADPDLIKSEGNIGYALLLSLSAVIPQAYADKLEICIGNINGSMDEEIRWKQAMNGRSIVLDLLLCTDVTKDQCRELSNYFNSICCSLQQPHPQQPNAPPQQEMAQSAAHPIEFDNLNIEYLLNSFRYDEEEKKLH